MYVLKFIVSFNIHTYITRISVNLCIIYFNLKLMHYVLFSLSLTLPWSLSLDWNEIEAHEEAGKKLANFSDAFNLEEQREKFYSLCLR